MTCLEYNRQFNQQMVLMNNVDGKSSLQFHVTFLIQKMNFSSCSALDIQRVVFFHYKMS